MDAAWWFRCYRATCSLFLRATGSTVATLPAVAPTSRPYTAPTLPLDPFCYWYDKLSQYERSSGYFSAAAEDGNVMVTTCRSLTGARLGVQTRDPQKVIRTYPETPAAVYFTARVSRNLHTLFIVEDARSAVRIEQCNGDAIALLGTTLFESVREDIAREAPECIMIWLDPGAEEAAARLAEKLRLIAPTSIWSSRRDPKDCLVEEIKRIVDAVYSYGT